MDKQQIKNILEAMIFASDSPVTMNQLTTILENVEKKEIEEGLEDLQKDLEPRAIFLKKVSGGYEFATRPAYSKYLKKLLDFKINTRLSRAALEVLSIVSFKQPISKVEISAIRGVNSDGVMKSLLERRLITITGRDNGPGRPLLFATTKEFLHYFSLNSVEDLPRPKEIDELLAEGEGGKILSDLPDEAVLTENEGEEQDEKKTENEEIPKEEKENPTEELEITKAKVDDKAK